VGDSCPVFVRRGVIISLVVMDRCVLSLVKVIFDGALPPFYLARWSRRFL
jgi:hypothetical protein